ncbi:GTP-binding protein [Candidatus Borrarchaeum sp.]|uniref:GTP-binding protein n=1 Tax=Candidatus Borrarchaeum sp. TaxID=2846742 RepID=UPI00257E8A1E|nr:GTP-binding protein [Candidatus Borrarchaeum sp.]
MKIIITGAFSSGKSTLVQSLAKESAISLDKSGTTVALDHGTVDVLGIPAFLFGTPGLVRFSILRQILSEGADGMIFMVDSANPNIENFNEIWQEMQEIQIVASIPCVIAANKQDLPGAKSVEEIRGLLGLTGYPIIPISAKTGNGMMRPLLILLLINILRASSLLRIIDRIGTENNALEQIADMVELGRYKTKLRLYWLEWRGLIEADWNSQRFKVVPAVKKVFEILPRLIRSYEEIKLM